MKHMNQLCMLCLIMIFACTSEAQVQSSNRSELFRNTSQRVMAKTLELDKAFSASTGTLIKLQFKNFDFEGTLTASLKRYDNLHSVLITSAALDNTLFSISKRINEDKTVSYTGRIINNNYADGYELIQEEDGGYVLNKIKTEVLLQDY